MMGKAERRSALRMAGFVGALGLMAAALALEPFLGENGVLALALLAGALGTGACVAWFVGLDEMAQRAHYVAWFWGSSLGAMVAVLAFGVASLFGATEDFHVLVRQAFGHDDDLSDGMMAGMLAVIVPMLAGYAAWWTVFWLRRR